MHGAHHLQQTRLELADPAPTHSACAAQRRPQAEQRTLVPAVHAELLVAVQLICQAHLGLAARADEHRAALLQRVLKRAPAGQDSGGRGRGGVDRGGGNEEATE